MRLTPWIRFWIDVNVIVSGKFLCLFLWGAEISLRDSKEVANGSPKILPREVELLRENK